MPKLRKTQLDEIKKMCHFGTSLSTNHVTIEEYHDCNSDQMRNYSLRSLEVFECLVSLLEETSFECFNEVLWTYKADLTYEPKAFLEIIKFTLCSFHLSCRSQQLFSQNHERTHFVENIIPSLLALAKVTGLVEFKWWEKRKGLLRERRPFIDWFLYYRCESPFLSSRLLNQREYDYDYRSVPANKLIDALGILRTANNMELIVVEASR